MRKIAVIGCAGTGKSYLACRLQEILDLPLYHLDKYYWKSGWVRSNPEEFQKIHNELCNEERCIIEGSYLRYLESRFEAADTIIFIDLPRWFCLFRVFKRAIFNWGKVMPTSPKDCPEGLTLEFVKWVWNFNKKYRTNIISLLNKYSNSKKIYIIKNQKEFDNFIETLKS